MSGGDVAAAEARCAWSPPARDTVVRVDRVGELERAVRESGPGAAILLADGDYALSGTLEMRHPGVLLSGEHGDARRVVLHGFGMEDRRVGVAIAVGAPSVTIAALTIRDVAFHGIQIRGESGAADAVVHGVVIRDAGQQLVKVSIGPDGRTADRGMVACSRLEYSVGAPSDYTNGIDVLGGRGWTIRDNRLLRIRGPESARFRAGPAILLWAGAADSLVERNRIVDSHRGIALGLGRTGPGGRSADHHGGTIRHNVIVNRHGWADEGIEANAAPGVLIEDNVVDHAGTLPWSISVRFPSTVAVVRGNRVARAIVRRDGASARIEGNRVGPLSAVELEPRRRARAW